MIVDSVTRFGEILPLWQKNKRIWHFEGYLVYDKILTLLWEILHAIGQIFIHVNGLKLQILSYHLVTLVVDQLCCSRYSWLAYKCILVKLRTKATHFSYLEEQEWEKNKKQCQHMVIGMQITMHMFLTYYLHPLQYVKTCILFRT